MNEGIDQTRGLPTPEMATGGYPASIELPIVQMLCSRLCHDLAGPAGAVGAGVDLLGEAASPDPEALELVAFGARQLGSRLGYYRVAFGFGGTAASLSWQGVRTLAEDLFAASRVELLWTNPASQAAPDLPSEIFRLATLLMLVSAEALPRGGTLTVDAAPVSPECLLSILVSGASVILNSEISSALRGDADGIVTSRTVTAFYAARLAETLGATIDVETHDAAIELRVALSASSPEM